MPSAVPIIAHVQSKKGEDIFRSFLGNAFGRMSKLPLLALGIGDQAATLYRPVRLVPCVLHNLTFGCRKSLALYLLLLPEDDPARVSMLADIASVTVQIEQGKLVASGARLRRLTAMYVLWFPFYLNAVHAGLLHS
jgi:hypothetical protein